MNWLASRWIGKTSVLSQCFLVSLIGTKRLFLIICLIAWSLSRTPPKHLPLYVAFFGLDFSARYIDPILLSPLFLSSILNYSRACRKNIWSQILRIGVLLIIFVMPALCFHFLTLGSVFATPYDDKVPATDRLLTSSLSGEGIADQASGR